MQTATSTATAPASSPTNREPQHRRLWRSRPPTNPELCIDRPNASNLAVPDVPLVPNLRLAGVQTDRTDTPGIRRY